MEGILEINFEARKVEFERDGKTHSFLRFTGATNKGKKCTFKFRKETENLPKKEGKYTMFIPSDKINRDKSSIYLEYWISVEKLDYKVFEPKVKADEEIDF